MTRFIFTIDTMLFRLVTHNRSEPQKQQLKMFGSDMTAFVLHQSFQTAEVEDVDQAFGRFGTINAK